MKMYVKFHIRLLICVHVHYIVHPLGQNVHGFLQLAAQLVQKAIHDLFTQLDLWTSRNDFGAFPCRAKDSCSLCIVAAHEPVQFFLCVS